MVTIDRAPRTDPDPREVRARDRDRARKIPARRRVKPYLDRAWRRDLYRCSACAGLVWAGEVDQHECSPPSAARGIGLREEIRDRLPPARTFRLVTRGRSW